MTEWIEAGSGFIEADVIRWKEGIFERRGPGGRRPLKIGDRRVVAEVVGEPDREGWVMLVVNDCEIIGQISGVKQGRRNYRLGKGATIKRKIGTIRRGKPERLAWSDESNRAALASRFLGNKEHKKWFMAMDMDDDE